MHIHIQAYTSLKKISDCLIYCILSNGEVIKYHKFIPVVVIELSVRGLNTGPEDRLPCSMCSCLCGFCNNSQGARFLKIDLAQLSSQKRFDFGNS